MRLNNRPAVIYCRVSSKKQAREGNGLSSQETRCREYAGHRGHNVVGVYTDDISGAYRSRTGIDAMIAFLRKNRKLGLVVIIDDISRMAREKHNHFDLKDAILLAGAWLESPSIEFGHDSDSLFMENVLASVAQHARQKNAEQVKNRMRARLQNGFWVFHAPTGYEYQRSPAGGSVLVRKEPLASIIGEGLEGYANGRFSSQSEVKRFWESHAGFPVTRHGHLTNEQTHRILTNPVYAGYVESEIWDVSLREGQHEGVISLETFMRVQEYLNGKPVAPARADIHEDFPLRGFVTCGDCQHPMTANWTKGRTATYPYYVCRHRGCAKFGKSVARAKVEGAFETLLRALKPSHELVAVLSAVFRKRWNDRIATVKDEKARLKLEAAGVDKKIGQLLDRIVASDCDAVISAYERKVGELEREKLVLAEKTARCGTALPDYDATFRTAFEFLSNPCNLWENGTFEDKRIVLKLTLDTHLEYDWKEGVRTPEISLPFKVLEDISGREKELADRVGFEPTVSVNPRRFSRPLP